MTREQEDTVDRLALAEGSLYIRDGYADRALRVTGESRRHWIVGEDGTPRPAKADYSRIPDFT
jgi:hypothetical protein